MNATRRPVAAAAATAPAAANGGDAAAGKKPKMQGVYQPPAGKYSQGMTLPSDIATSGESNLAGRLSLSAAPVRPARYFDQGARGRGRGRGRGRRGGGGGGGGGSRVVHSY